MSGVPFEVHRLEEDIAEDVVAAGRDCATMGDGGMVQTSQNRNLSVSHASCVYGDELRAGRRRGVETMRGAVLLGCSLVALMGVLQLCARSSSGKVRSALLSASFPGGNLLGGPASWEKFLALGGQIAPANNVAAIGSQEIRLAASPALPQYAQQMVKQTEFPAPLHSTVSTYSRNIETMAPLKENIVSTGSSQMWPSSRQLENAISAAGGAGAVHPSDDVSTIPLAVLPASLVQAASRVSAARGRGRVPWLPIDSQEQTVDGGAAISEAAAPDLMQAMPPTMRVWGTLPMPLSQVQVSRMIPSPNANSVGASATRTYNCLGGGGAAEAEFCGALGRQKMLRAQLQGVSFKYQLPADTRGTGGRGGGGGAGGSFKYQPTATNRFVSTNRFVLPLNVGGSSARQGDVYRSSVAAGAAVASQAQASDAPQQIQITASRDSIPDVSRAMQPPTPRIYLPLAPAYQYSQQPVASPYAAQPVLLPAAYPAYPYPPPTGGPNAYVPRIVLPARSAGTLVPLLSRPSLPPPVVVIRTTKEVSGKV
jgi:hypothetical protein